MKKITSFCVALTLCAWGFAQQKNEGEDLDLLKAPSSPAAQLLNFAPSSIERPTDLSSFWLSLSNATSNFNKLPTSYAVDFVPASLFGSGSITLKDLQERRNLGKIMWQTLDVSLGFKSEEDSLTQTSFYRTGIGVKFSLVRPAWSEATNRSYKTIAQLQRKITEAVEVADEDIEADTSYKAQLAARTKARRDHGMSSPEYKTADSMLNTLRQTLLDKFRTEKVIANNNTYTELKKQAREFTIERVGFFLDFAGGFAVRFPTNQLGYSFADNAGAWLTGGYEGGNKALSFYGIARYLYQPEKIYADTTNTISNKKISTFDMGARLLYATDNDKFNFGGEAIYRSVLNKSIVDPSWRVVFSAEYDLGFNRKLTFNFGRDFNGVVTRGGNLIAALNLIAGFGNKKPVN
jgi:hypothetical protein